VQVLNHPKGISNGDKVSIKINLGPLALPWHLQIEDVIPGSQFADRQLSGPFDFWKHSHEMHPVNDSHSLLVESIKFESPFGFLTKHLVTDKLRRLFKFRFNVIENDIKRHYMYKDRSNMKILVTGASGLVGKSLVDFLSSGGHEVFKLVRHEAKDSSEIQWTPASLDQLGYVDLAKLEGFDAVVHLAGENIAARRWTAKQKQKIYDSRIYATKFLARSLAKLEKPPRVFISASAIGIYGDKASESLDESSIAADDFLAKTCKDWEEACKPALDKGIRVVNARFGIILHPRGGALAKMLPLFQLGGGGILGSGKQYMSWVALDDVIAALHHCLMNETLSGAVNVVAPEAVTNIEFTKVLARVLRRPAIFPAPALALKLVLGEMAEALLLPSTRVKPDRLLSSGFKFSYEELETAFKHML